MTIGLCAAAGLTSASTPTAIAVMKRRVMTRPFPGGGGRSPAARRISRANLPHAAQARIDPDQRFCRYAPHEKNFAAGEVLIWINAAAPGTHELPCVLNGSASKSTCGPPAVRYRFDGPREIGRASCRERV